MASEITQGWHDDPFRLHEQRYFSAGRPTKLVRDGRVETYEEPPADAVEPARSAADAGVLANGQAPPATVGVSSSRAAAPGASEERPRRSGNGLVTGIAALALAAGVALLVMVFVSGPGSPRLPRAPRSLAVSDAAFVMKSARQTLGERTADVTVSGDINVAGQSVAVTGSGETDFSANAVALDIHLTVSGHSLAEREILTHGNLYIAVRIDGKSLAHATGGRAWIQMPVAQSRSANLLGSDPLSTLSVLEQQGNSVRNTGTTIIAGVSCTGYAVIPTKQAMISAARKEFSSLGLPAAVTSAELSMIKAMSPPTTTIWLDAHGIMRQMSVSLQVGGLSNVGGSDLVMGFYHYGALVQISAPAPSDVVSYKALLKALHGPGAL
jgi:hypothetical protein